jgi:hypothetical protein
MLPLPIKVSDLHQAVILPAATLLPDNLNTLKAQVLLAATAGQESGLATRRQYGNGPARGLWQFELGNEKTRGGVTGLFMFAGTKSMLNDLCDDCEVDFNPTAIYNALETNDVFACCIARLMLWTNSKPLPEVGDQQGAWQYYLTTWKPGKPRPQDWPNHYNPALEMVK